MPELSTEIRYLKGIGEKKALSFKKLGVSNCHDLISFFPRAYDDRSQYKEIAELIDGESACVRAMVSSVPHTSHIRRGMDITKLRVADDTGSMDLTYFNQSYVKDQLKTGEVYIFYGKVTLVGGRRSMTNPVREREGQEGGVTGRIVPIYRLTAGLSQKTVISAVRSALDELLTAIPDELPESVRAEYDLCQTPYAYENIHFPADYRALELARRRLAFEEFFYLACALALLRQTRSAGGGIRLGSADLREFYSSLPFTPTAAQRRAVDEAVGDMTSGRPMSRLIQGDVGSGKTLVAAACCWYAYKSGYQCAFMAPTGILAEQHLKTLTGFLEPLGMRVMKLTGSLSAKEKREVKAALADGTCDLVIGTHALLTGDVEFRSLALTVTDEQHRFGVDQRSALSSKTGAPHVLVMSATPIPRTLALIIYGDLDVSIIDELPPGRQRVDTFAVDGTYRERLNAFIKKLVAEGRQVFVVCPMIDENDELPMDLKPVSTHAEELREALPELRIECVHGRMREREKDEIMSRFLEGGIDVLVSTTVIEVGVDIPNAALMIVENAERFGLSQLHQLRGRVGRGGHKSYCVLVSDAKNEESRARLTAMTKTADGFRIAEEDLRLRGPGDFFGSRQHGLPEMHVADLGGGMDILSQAQTSAERLLKTDPELRREENAPLRGRVEKLIASVGGSFN